MYNEYVNADPVLANDDKKGLKKREYQDNIEDILLTENEIEELQNRFKEQEEKLKSLQADEGKAITMLLGSIPSLLVQFLLCLFLAMEAVAPWGVIIIPIALQALVGVVCITCYKSTGYKKYKANKIRLFLENEITRKKGVHEELKDNKTKNIEPTNEKVSLKEQNKEREELWNQKIALVELYYENEERFLQYYKEGTLFQDFSIAEQETLNRILEIDHRKE